MSIIYHLNNLLSNGELEQQKVAQIESALTAFRDRKIDKWLNNNHIVLSHNSKSYQFLCVISMLEYLDRVVMGHGIEVIEDVDIANAIYSNIGIATHGSSIAYYLNTGDTYNTTILYDRVFDRLLVTTMGDYIEEIESVKAIAAEIENLVNSGVIEWDEWDDAFPIRLQKVGSSLQLFYGTPDFDNTHAGFWGYYSICPDNNDYLEIAIDLYDQCLGMEVQNASN